MSIGRTIVCLSVILVATAAAQENARIENTFLKVVVAPQGGRIISFEDRAAGSELVAAPDGMCVDRDWTSRITEMANATYALNRTANGIEAAYTVKDPKLQGIEYAKTYRLAKDSPALDVTLRIRNTAKRRRELSPWVFNRVMAGGAPDDSDAFFIPAVGGVGRVELANAGKAIADNFFENPRAGWIGLVDRKKQQGLIVLCDEEKLARFYVWCGSKPGTMEWIYSKIQLQPTEEWTTTYSILPLHGIADLSGASPHLVASLARTDDEAAQTISLSLISPFGIGQADIRAQSGGTELARISASLERGKAALLTWPATKVSGPDLEIDVTSDKVKEKILIPLAEDGSPRAARVGRTTPSQRGGPERFHIASVPIETKHIAWAKPLPGGPVRTLCLVPIPSQRDIIELAQRLEMKYDLVAFQYPLMDTAAVEEFLELLTGNLYDVVILSKVPMGLLPPEVQDVLVDRVKKGTGVLSVNTTSTVKTGAVINVRDNGAFLETALPLHILPEDCRPSVNVGQCAKGRCVSLTYPGRVTCLTPEVESDQANYRDWECYFELIARAVLWAARRETGVVVKGAWPAAVTEEKAGDQWHMERLVQVTQPHFMRANNTWKVDTTEATFPLETWRGYGAKVAKENGKLKITEANLNGDRGFGAGVFDVDATQTPILEVTADSAKEWALFIPDRHFEKVLATLQPKTTEKGTQRYDLRKFDALRDLKSICLCFSTIGEGSSLVLSSMRFLRPDGTPIAGEKQQRQVPESTNISLRIASETDTDVTVAAAIHGPDYYDGIERHEQRVTLPKGREVEVQFPLVNVCAGKHHAVDLVVRDMEGRSLAFATASYDVISPVVLTSLETEKEFYQRGDRAVIVAKIENKAGERDVELHISLTDMHGRLITALDKKTRIPSGESQHNFPLATDNSLTVLNRARLTVRDAKGLLLQEDVYVYLPEQQPAWDDYLASTSQFSVRNAYIRPYFTQIARETGIEGMVIRPRDTLEMLGQGVPVMYWGAAKIRAFGYNFRGTETSTARKPCLSDPETRNKITEAYEELGSELRRFGPLAIASLEDESELSGARYSTLEVCTSEHCTKRYRNWLKEKYKTVQALNEQWSTSHKTFDEIIQITYKEARTLDNPAQWVDWRTFMEYVWLDALLLTRKGVKKNYPELRMGFSNSFGEMPFSGWNFEKVSSHVDMTIEYPTIIDRITLPKEEDAFEDDAVNICNVIRQKVDIRKSFMRKECPLPGWIWYDRSEQGAEFKPWWMAFLGAKGCTPWGACSLGVRTGAKHMSFWAFFHPLLAHTNSSKWLASGLHDLTRGVGKIFIDYDRVVSPAAVLYSQPSMHVAWVWSDVEKAFYPELTSLYAWYYKSRVNVTRMLRELGATSRYIGTRQIEAGDLKDYKILFLPCSLSLSDATMKRIRTFVESGGVVVADIGAGATDENGKPLPHRKLVEDLFAISRTSIGRKIEPAPLRPTSPGELEVPQGLGLAGKDALVPRITAAATREDGAPAIVVSPVGKGKTIYLNGFLGYNMPSRLLLRNILALANISTPIRITSAGREHMGYECTTFRRGDIEILGILRLREEENATEITLGKQRHLYDVRGKRYFGLTNTASFDLTYKAAAVLALMPYEITGVEARALPENLKRNEKVEIKAKVVAASGRPGDHVLRMEVYDPSGRLSRAYTDNLLAINGNSSRTIQTALNDQPGRWRIVITDVISGKKAQADFDITD